MKRKKRINKTLDKIMKHIEKNEVSDPYEIQKMLKELYEKSLRKGI